MVALSFFLLGFLLVAVQTTFFHHFPHWLGRPDLTFVLLVFSAYKFSWFPGLLLAFLLGWLMDVTSGVFLGTYLLLVLIVFCIVKFLSQNSSVKETVFQIPLVGVSYFIVQCFFYLFFSFTQPGALPPWSWSRVVQETLILLVASIPCFVFFNWLYEKLTTRRLASKRLKRSGGNQFR
jgi:rod shape-determining protein MreD